MKPGFYEFEFTVAFIHDFLKKNEARGSQAMVGMPPPAEEAQVGYDALLAADGYPRFFQFKRPDHIGAGLGNQGHHYPDQPYYRIKITPHEDSWQHNLLVNLANRGNEVYYVAPVFHENQQLSRYQSAEQIMEQSIWVPTKDLHLQKEGDRSCITYLPDGTWRAHPGETSARRSEPSYEYPEAFARTRRIDRDYYAGFLRNLEEIVAQETGQEPGGGNIDLGSRALQETETPEARTALRVVPEPGAYRRVTESNRVRSLLHSRFGLRAITVSNPRP